MNQESKFKAVLWNLDTIVASVVLAILIVLTFAGVPFRYLLGAPFTWLEEVQLACMVWIVYGGAGAEHTAAIREMARLEGIFLDPVYTGKAFAHFLSLLRAGEFTGENLLFVHSGGAGGLFAVDLPE